MINGRVIALLLGIFVALLSFFINSGFISNLIAQLVKSLAFEKWTDAEELEVLDAWRRIIVPSGTAYANILIGLNSCLDLIAPALVVFKAMNLSVPDDPADFSMIADKEQYASAFAEFFRRGHAAERTFVDGQLFSTFVQAAEKVPEAKKLIGGNAALMAEIMTQYVGETTNITLIGPVGPDVQKMLSQRLRVPPACLVAKDEVHLILEFAVGDRLGPYVAPVANRFIVSHDEANTRLRQLPSLVAEWQAVQPGLVVLAGLHMLETLPFADWTLVIDQLAASLRERGDSAVVHLELASMTDRQRVFLLAQKIFPLVSSIGLNEQELCFLSQALGGPHSELVGAAQPQPAVGEAADLLVWLLSSFEGTRLSRVHFHSLTFHLLASRPQRWANSAAAVAAGARTASARACGVPEPESGLADLRLPRLFRLSGLGEDEAPTTFVPAQGVLGWTKQDVDIVMAPVLVCRRPLQTVGLGDSVSAAGLIFSQAVGS